MRTWRGIFGTRGLAPTGARSSEPHLLQLIDAAGLPGATVQHCVALEANRPQVVDDLKGINLFASFRESSHASSKWFG